MSPAELAQTPGVRECLEWFARERRWIDERHLQICRVPAPTFLEQRRAEWILAQFREIGCECRMDKAGNVLATLDVGATRASHRDGPYIALTAHLDTVLAPRTPDEIHVGPDGRFYGPGVADNGSGLAALLAIARALKSCPPILDLQASLLLAANVGEEGEGNLSGMRHLCRQSPLASKIRGFLILDGPGTDYITSQALASRRFELTFTGPGGHSWNDYGTANPVHALGRAIARFAENRLNGGVRSSYNFGLIEGGMSINSIPTSARAKLDLRSESQERLDEMEAWLTSAVERALEAENARATCGRATARIREIGNRPGGSLPDDSPILQALRSVDALLGIKASQDCASTDANIPLSMGLPAVSIGAGGEGGGAHSPAEWFHPEGRELALRRIVLTLCLLLRHPPPEVPARSE